MKEIHLDRKRKLILELNNINSEITKLKKKSNELKKDIETIEKAGIVLSEHAYQRYKERVYKTNKGKSKVRKYLLTSEFLELIRDKENGIFLHPNIPGLNVVIKDNSIVTLYGEYNPDEEINKLTEYMNYFIDNILEKGYKMSFKEFKSKL